MTSIRGRNKRRGTVLVMVVLLIFPLLALVALAVDLGMLTLAKTQAQQAADSAAMAGARTLNGITAAGNNNNYSNVTPKAQTAATGNKILSTAITSSQVTVNIGRYVYVAANQRFEGQFPGPATENWSLVQAHVNVDVSSKMGFSKIFSYVVPSMQAEATSAHRPRDVAIVLDYSGSMRFASLIGTPTSGSSRVSNNGDPVIPTFGAYSSASAALQASTFTQPYDEANITRTSPDGRGAVVTNFHSDAAGSPAFTSASSAYGTTPGGDNALKSNLNTSATWAQTVADVLNLAPASVTSSTRDATFEAGGYTSNAMNATFNGYTQGPGYWGKTFFIWPPDPRAAQDWRRLYFTVPGTSTGVDDNSRLWDASGNWRAPGAATYSINYTAILAWLKSGPNPFPSRLQSGRILYYDSIPDTIDTSTFPPTDMNQRFWKEYIDYCLGAIQTGANSWTLISSGSAGYTGYGRDYTWGTVRITAKASLGGAPAPYMHYLDNPKRPKMHFWFGPMSMVDFLGCYNLWGLVSPTSSRFCWWPGTCYESPMYACKLGIRAALTDIQNNHPNDTVAMIMFSVPNGSANDANGRRFNRVRVPLGRDYASMQEYLWYPPSTVGNANATVRPFDANNIEVPRAMGGTCYSMPLMLAYNQFSGNVSLQTYNAGGTTGDAGGNGRRGAQKIIIFETDGAPNTTASGVLQNNGAYQSYYNVRYNSANPGGSEYPTSINSYVDNDPTVTAQVFSLCAQIAALDSAGPPGYSTVSKPLQIHCIGFGPQFDPSSAGQAAAVATLNQMQTLSGVTDGMPSYKIVYGTEAAVVAKLQEAFTRIMQSGVQISLIQ